MRYLFISALIFVLGCGERESIITLVDIDEFDKDKIASGLEIINKNSPRVVGLDFFPEGDSIEQDLKLIEVFIRMSNLVQPTVLNVNNASDESRWDSLRQYHPSLRFGSHGFSNLTITKDSVLVRKLPMYQYYRNDVEFAFSYAVASRYNSYKIGSKYKNGSDEISFGKDEFGHHFKVISIHELIAGRFAKEDLEDKIVILGYIRNSDPFYLDKERTIRISGTEIQASLISKMLN